MVKKVINILYIICICVFIYSSYRLVNIYLEYRRGSVEYNEIRNEVEVENRVENQDADKGIALPINIDFKKLEKINKDIVGWIYIEASPKINYPILKGMDNDFYLRRTYKKTKNIAGSIFIDYRNTGDFMDYNTIIYGHNMKNSTMFSRLEELKKNPKETLKKPYIWVITPKNVMVYKIFSIHEEPAISDTYNIIKSKDDEYYKYARAEAIKNRVSGLNNDANGSRIITLSTCTDNDKVRMVVQARLEDIK